MEENRKPLTLTEKVEANIRSQIDCGVYEPGNLIPSEHQLAEIHEVSRVTIRQALQKLVESGYLIKHKGSGTYVNPNRALSHSYKTGSFSENCRKKGIQVHTKILSIEEIPVPYDIDKFMPKSTQQITAIQRLRYTNGKPCLIEIDYLSNECQFLAQEIKDDSSIFELLQQHKIGPVVSFEEEFSITSATKEISQTLDIPQKTPLLEVIEVLRDYNDELLYINRQFIYTKRYKHRIQSSCL